MKKCPSCGFNNGEERERCLKCSTLLSSQAVPDGSHLADRAEPSFQPMVQVRQWLYALSRRFESRLPTGVSHRFPWTAAYLALLLGAGQFYNHQPKKGIAFAMIQIAMWIWFIATIFEPWNNYVALALVFWHFYMMADGFIIAARINGDPWRFRHLLAIWFALMFFLGATLFLGQFFGHGAYYLTSVRFDDMSPAIKQGDKVFVLSSLIYRKTPKPGALIFFNPARYKLMTTSDTGDDYMVNPQSAFGVVTGREGDVITCSADGVIRVNGEPAPARLLPLTPNGVPWGIEVVVPPKAVGVLPSTSINDPGVLGSGLLGGSVSNPRRAMQEGRLLEDYGDAAIVYPPHDLGKEQDGTMFGIALFCYYPPERRRWFGFSGGVWRDYPAGYPEAAR